MHRCDLRGCRRRIAIWLGPAMLAAVGAHAQSGSVPLAVQGDGSYSVGATLRAQVAAQIDGRWLRSADYPRHTMQHSAGTGPMGPAEVWQVRFTGLADAPTLIYTARVYTQHPFADVQVTVANTTGHPVHVESLRPLEALGEPMIRLSGPAAADRVLSDSFSEDRPAMKLHDLGQTDLGQTEQGQTEQGQTEQGQTEQGQTGQSLNAQSLDHAVGSQLIYNRDSHQSLFVGALTSDTFLTILRLHLDGAAASPHIAHYEVDCTGTTELERDNSLEHSPAGDQIDLSLPVAPGASLSSETIALSVSSDYHAQLETYGATIRALHHARVDAPPLMGWWSWTAYYFGLNQGAALTNAQWEAEHLKSYGYDVFHIDEGYQYARGEYATPNAALFPDGMTPMEYDIRGLGLVPGIWTAPFEVSVRSWVYTHHPEWLVHTAQGQPIRAGSVDDGKDALYILDTTNPGAQEYLRQTYTTMVRQWGIHYIKLDFMDDSAIEGYYFKPNTTAMQAQRTGLQIIRDAVGPDVYLDKDGSVMLNPVGYVDYGRISQDTGHSFTASRDAAPGIAARYYMNRNYFVADPDAFTVSTQRITDQTWHEGKQALTLAEAQVSMALAAVSGGMLEIGDNLPSLQNSPERVALLRNQDLINMVRLGQASVPLDLMSYSLTDEQPSLFLLKESARQSVLTVFNWTEHPTDHSVRLADDLGLAAAGRFRVVPVLDKATTPLSLSMQTLHLHLAPHAVAIFRIVDENVPAVEPRVQLDCPSTAVAGATIRLGADADGNTPVLSYRWSFGDGVELEGAQVEHAWTEPGSYVIQLTATGVDGRTAEASRAVRITGNMPTTFNPTQMTRFRHGN